MRGAKLRFSGEPGDFLPPVFQRWEGTEVHSHSPLITARDATVESLNHNNDGCDPDSCSDVLIERCTFRTGDDGIAIKAGRDQDAWRVTRSTERVLVRDCDFHSRINGLCIGSEMSGDVRHVFMENCRVHDAFSALYLKTNTDCGGIIEDVFIRNIQVTRARAAVLRFDLAYKDRRDGPSPSALRRITASSIDCAQADTYGLYLEGLPDHPVADIPLTDIAIARCAHPLWRRHTQNLHLANVIVNDTALPADPPEAAPDATPLTLRM